MWDKRKGSLSGAFFNFGEWLVNVGFLCYESANAYRAQLYIGKFTTNATSYFF